MISIKPEWVCKILNKEKLVEIRKTMPKCELPCKVYIYCTNNKNHMVAPFRFVEGWKYKEYNDNTSYANGCTANMGETINGKVVAEFTLNKVSIADCDSIAPFDKQTNEYLKCCLSRDDFWDYTNGNCAYTWHIDNLKIYEQPKELREFSTISHRMKGKESRFTSHILQRPFQSWGYVQELEEL